MISPNKFIPFAESALGHVQKIYPMINEPMSVVDLYKQSKKHFDSMDGFLYTLEVLYLADKVEIDLLKGTIRKC